METTSTKKLLCDMQQLKQLFVPYQFEKNGVACAYQRTFDKKLHNSTISCSICLKFSQLMYVAMTNIRGNFHCKKSHMKEVMSV